MISFFIHSLKKGPLKKIKKHAEKWSLYYIIVKTKLILSQIFSSEGGYAGLKIPQETVQDYQHPVQDSQRLMIL